MNRASLDIMIDKQVLDRIVFVAVTYQIGKHKQPFVGMPLLCKLLLNVKFVHLMSSISCSFEITREAVGPTAIAQCIIKWAQKGFPDDSSNHVHEHMLAIYAVVLCWLLPSHMKVGRSKIEAWQLKEIEKIADCRVFSLHQTVSESPLSGDDHNFYVLETADWVNVVPVTSSNEIVCIKFTINQLDFI